MTEYSIEAWRDNTAARGIEISQRTAIGWDNVVCELILIGEEEVDAFIRRVQEARDRAFSFEPIPEIRHEYVYGEKQTAY